MHRSLASIFVAFLCPSLGCSRMRRFSVSAFRPSGLGFSVGIPLSGCAENRTRERKRNRNTSFSFLFFLDGLFLFSLFFLFFSFFFFFSFSFFDGLFIFASFSKKLAVIVYTDFPESELRQVRARGGPRSAREHQIFYPQSPFSLGSVRFAAHTFVVVRRPTSVLQKKARLAFWDMRRWSFAASCAANRAASFSASRAAS